MDPKSEIEDMFIKNIFLFLQPFTMAGLQSLWNMHKYYELEFYRNSNSIVYGYEKTQTLKALTDHFGGGSRVVSFDPYS
jgi:hypothetical protein